MRTAKQTHAISYVTLNTQSAPYLMHRKETDEGGPLIGNDRFEGFCAELAKKVTSYLRMLHNMRCVASSVNVTAYK